jgi:uncharacterized membrane protein
MMYWGHHMGAGSWIFSILATLTLLVLIVGAFVWAVGRLGGGGRTQTPEPPAAREILDRRLASGELTSEEYDLLLGKLCGGSRSADDMAKGSALGAVATEER